MSGECIDHGIERHRHDGFVGRAVLAARPERRKAAGEILDPHLPVCRTRDGIHGNQLVLPSLDPPR
jgi:hypothetical protein